MSELGQLAKGFASQLAQDLKDKLEGDWEKIPEADKEEVAAVLKDWSALTLRKLAGEEVGRELAHTKAAMASWKFVGSSKVQRALRETLKEAAVFAGKVILGLVV